MSKPIRRFRYPYEIGRAFGQASELRAAHTRQLARPHSCSSHLSNGPIQIPSLASVASIQWRHLVLVGPRVYRGFGPAPIQAVHRLDQPE